MGYSARRGFTNGKISGAARQAELQQKIAAMQEKMTEAQDAVEAQVGSAVNEALRQANDAMENSMNGVTGGLDLSSFGL